ncbi:aminotransferase class III-fold pyridoxal phosphate-dependent enzyme [bacterium]|nr:aminotransferase class III-fold pyridoxal phosphate-dependent enzyme [bacterium]
MKESVGYSDLIQFGIDPLAPDSSKEGTKFRIYQASGVYLHTTNNLQIMDFTAGKNGNNLGHNHPKVLSAAVNQMEKYSRSAGNFDNSKTIYQLRKSLSGLLPLGLDSFFFTNTEEEAVRYAVWLAQTITKRSAVIRIKYCQRRQQMNTNNPSLIKAEYKVQDYNSDPSTYYVECCISPKNISEITIEIIISELLSCIRDLICPPTTPAKISAIIVELGEEDNGFLLPPAFFFSALRYLCDRYRVLFILDERATAIGRTGRMLASQALDVKPDLTIVGKGIANGYSLGCVVIKHGIVPGLLEGGWNEIEVDPISCAAALATLDVIYTENLLKNCREMGDRLLAGLHVLQKRFPIIEDVRGAGLNLTLEFIQMENNSSSKSSAAWDLVCFSLEQGLLTYCAGSRSRAVCMIPPLNVTEDQVDSALRILGQGLERI